MTEEYKIHSIWYSKPHFTRDGHGEILHYRVGVAITLGEVAPFDSIFMKKVVDIQYKPDHKLFYVYFEKGGVRTIPLAEDTEVTYVTKESKT